MRIYKVGNIVGGVHQAGTTYLAIGLCPTLTKGMDHGNTMPFIVEVKKIENHTNCRKSN